MPRENYDISIHAHVTAGAKLTREVFFNLWKYSSLVPRQRRQKKSLMHGK
jgi:hypothetical protein